MIERVYVLSHTDLDGYFSAGLVQHYIKLQNFETEVYHKSWTYGWNTPSVEYIKKNFDKVYIVDLCLPFEFMYALWEHFQDKFIWIDHHIKPDAEFLIKFHTLSSSEILGLRETREHTCSAARLVFKYFEGESRESALPYWLQYISDFDCWNRTNEKYWQNNVMPMFSKLKNEVTSPSTAYDYIKQKYDTGAFYNTEDGMCQLGKELDVGKIMYSDMKAAYNADAKHGFERTFLSYNRETIEIKPLKAWICNTQNRSSVLFEDLPTRDNYDVFIPYHFNGEKYMYSMYTFKDTVHCNEISVLESVAVFYDDKDIVRTLQGAKRIVLSFNGHKDAAGANSEKFAFA